MDTTPGTHPSVYGSSPGTGGRLEKHSNSQAARKLLRRIQWDESLEANEFTVRRQDTLRAIYKCFTRQKGFFDRYCMAYVCLLSEPGRCSTTTECAPSILSS